MKTSGLHQLSSSRCVSLGGDILKCRYSNKDVNGSVYFPSQLECLQIFLLCICPTCPHLKHRWVNQLFICQWQPLTSCEVWICIWWQWGHFPCQPTDENGFSDMMWHWVQSNLVSSGVSQVHIVFITDSFILEKWFFIDIKFNSKIQNVRKFLGMHHIAYYNYIFSRMTWPHVIVVWPKDTLVLHVSQWG